MKTPGENIDFATTILSRFDMIFLVKDEHNEARDAVSRAPAAALQDLARLPVEGVLILLGLFPLPE